MAPPPEYDKEPKAPDKSATNISTEDSKLLHNLVNDQHVNSDHKPSNTVAAVEVENNKHVETLDDGQLRALLDEAITYKCPKDREGKSSLFKELLEEVEQDEQACEAAARTLSGARGTRRGGRGRRALPHSNSLQDLVAALAAEPAPRRHHVRHHPPAPPISNVSARAIHGGSLPSGVDTSSLLSEEPARGAGYLATVRCVNPPPLAERRVSASDANTPSEMELLNRRSKPIFPMTYTARATLEIGSGAVCSGRAVTTTTASNQVRTSTTTRTNAHPVPASTAGDLSDRNQLKLMNVLRPKNHTNDGGMEYGLHIKDTGLDVFKERKKLPRGPRTPNLVKDKREDYLHQSTLENDKSSSRGTIRNNRNDVSEQWTENVENWYKSLSSCSHFPYFVNTGQKEDKIVRQLETASSPKDQTNFQSASEKYIVVDSPNIKVNKKNNYFSELDLKKDPNYVPKILTTSHLPEKDSVMKFPPDESLITSDWRYHSKEKHRVVEHFEHDNKECDISLWKKYRQQVGKDLVLPSLSEINPRNFRRMTIGPNFLNISAQTNEYDNIDQNTIDPKYKTVNKITTLTEAKMNSIGLIDIVKKGNNAVIDNINKANQIYSSLECSNDSLDEEGITWLTNPVKFNKDEPKNNDIELTGVSGCIKTITEDSFTEYVSRQKKLLEAIGCNDFQNNERSTVTDTGTGTPASEFKTEEEMLEFKLHTPKHEIVKSHVKTESSETDTVERNDIICQSSKSPDADETIINDRIILAKMPKNAYIFLKLPKPLCSPINNDNNVSSILDIENNNNVKPFACESITKRNKKKNKEKLLLDQVSCEQRKSALDKNVLKVLLFESLFKNNATENLSGNPRVSAITSEEVDSAISFSCITTPEVVASCNTTSSTAQSAVAVDPKPLQLGSSYRAVASVVGSAAEATWPARAAAARPAAPSGAASAPAQPRSVISNTFNGLPLSRPNYGSTGTSATDDYKKSLDENGNSVQGFSSPLSGSSQHKKPRRKKSSKNETVIDCQQIDGYQGDKDVNELLRFIESNADNGRGAKLGRVKHKDDSDDKGGKKRSTERRKDKENKIKRATSMEELSRTKIEDLTDGAAPPRRADNAQRRADHAPAKAERRSWGDDALYSDGPADSAPAPSELTDFQTVTKKRKPRRRADEHEREHAPRRTRPPSPRPRRESAPPSDRSNDSNDDMDSVHSLPAAPPPAPPAPPPAAAIASYADIARTRHNIPDLIESCNFYSEGESGPRRDPAAVAGDADGYPALDARAAAARRRDARDYKPAAPPARRERKERAALPADGPRAPDCPAPDVVADRRPPVILLDSTVRPRDMDGITFGFDINEQLLVGGGVRRPRCDLVWDAAEGGVAVRAGCAALRYVPPEPPPDTLQLLQIVDYVGAAWEDVVRCGGGKVRYFSE